MVILAVEFGARSSRSRITKRAGEHSQWIGSDNFASVLFDGDFWYSMELTLIYTVMFMLFGFWVPIGLALLLSEVPKGKTFFRTVYYLPAVLSGLVVILLWKSFYSPEGLINSVLNRGVWFINILTHLHIQPFQSNWLDNHTTALLCCLLPTVWAGMGPGCLIYLAALKTVPNEIYEAGDIDGSCGRSIENSSHPRSRRSAAAGDHQPGGAR